MLYATCTCALTKEGVLLQLNLTNLNNVCDIYYYLGCSHLQCVLYSDCNNSRCMFSQIISPKQQLLTPDI